MNIELVDTELAESLKSFPDLDIWTDLVKTREMGAQMRAKMIGNLPPIEAVESEDYWLQQADGPEVWVRAYRPEKSGRAITRTPLDSWGRLLPGVHGSR